MIFALGFICGLIIGAVVTHLAHEYIDNMFSDKNENIEPPLWTRGKDEEK